MADPYHTPVDLPRAWPETVGIDSTVLVAMSRWIRQQRLAIRSLLVVRDGQLIFERYQAGVTRAHNHELYSITKSVAALLAGVLVAEGRLGPDSGLAEGIGRYRPDLCGLLADKRGITLAHLLAMSSGLRYPFAPDGDPLYGDELDRLAHVAAAEPARRPGTLFDYTDVNPVLAAALLTAAAGEPLPAFAERVLFGPLCFYNHAWTRADAAGLVSTGWGLRLRAMDLAKLGLLLLQRGRWQGRAVIPAEWIARMATPAVAPDYGWSLWLNHLAGAEPSLDMMGFKGQFVCTLPARNTVVVMTALLPVEGGLRDAVNVQLFRDLVGRFILPAIRGEGCPPMSEARCRALRRELSLSAHTAGVEATPAEVHDRPAGPVR